MSFFSRLFITEKAPAALCVFGLIVMVIAPYGGCTTAPFGLHSCCGGSETCLIKYRKNRIKTQPADIKLLYALCEEAKHTVPILNANTLYVHSPLLSSLCPPAIAASKQEGILGRLRIFLALIKGYRGWFFCKVDYLVGFFSE